MKKYKVKITNQAKEHLRIIRDYISNILLEPNSAKKLLKTLKEEIKSLSNMPERIRIIEEKPWSEYGFRKLIVKNYYIYFWIDKDNNVVNIIAIIYARRNQIFQLKNLDNKNSIEIS